MRNNPSLLTPIDNPKIAKAKNSKFFLEYIRKTIDIVNPIMTRMYQGASGEPSDSKVPEGMSTDGPSVEEVD